jgi:hypothetical protein
MFYEVICFAFLGTSLAPFMDVSWGNDEPKKAKQITS